MKRSLPTLAAHYVLASLVAAGALLIYWFPKHPTSWLGWLALFTLGLPALLLAEFLGEVIFFRNPVSQEVERRTKSMGFSWARIGYILLLSLILISIAIALSHWLGLGLNS